MVLTRLFYLQVVQGRAYRETALQISLRKFYAGPRRGRIVSRDGRVLAEDVPRFDLAIVPKELDPSGKVTRGLAPPLRELGELRSAKVRGLVLDGTSATLTLDLVCRPPGPGREARTAERTITIAGLDELLALARNLESTFGIGREQLVKAAVEAELCVLRQVALRSTPYVLVKDVPFEKAKLIAVRPDVFRGVMLRASMIRSYPCGSLAEHTVGYVGAIGSNESLETGESRLDWYSPEDRVGRTGIERSLERYLKGARGLDLVEVDVRGKRRSPVVSLEREDGADVRLSIDSRLQEVVESSLDGRVGAAVFLDVRTGEVLALASSPGFDPSVLGEEFAELSRDEESPLVNRAVSGLYPVGSIFKLVVAIAALQEGRYPSHVHCSGSYRGGRTCFVKTGHGDIDMVDAIKKSCNIFFYEVAGPKYLGISAMVKWGEAFGFGKPTGIWLPAEAAGVLPSPEWKRRVLHERWYPGDSLNLAIGQGPLLATPLQVARAMAILANHGKVIRPALVVSCERNGTVLYRQKLPVIDKNLELSKTAVGLVVSGMERAVNEPGGTAYEAFRDWPRRWQVAAKTGTAERVLRGKRENIGWFAGFAPYDRPGIAFAVVIEHLAEGETAGHFAAPVGRRMLEGVPEELVE